MAIKAPFNFVPLSDKVFFPKWANQISQDIPFSDGLSGTIDITITAEQPIFVRNGHTKEDGDSKNETYKSFSKMPDGRYFIPGTSIKGAIRNVLEIMSFSKITLDKKAKFAQREWNNQYLYSLKSNQLSLQCGYLKAFRENKELKYILENHGTPYRIGHDRIDDYIGRNVFRDKFSQKYGIDLNQMYPPRKDEHQKQFDPKTAAFKYYLVGDKKLTDLRFSISDTSTDHSTRLYVDPNGTIKGNIVLTGQPDKWMWPRPIAPDRRAGKFYEFVFPVDAINTITIPESDYEHFQFIYKDSSEWSRVKDLLFNEGVPVFFRFNDDQSVKDLGMAFLYKLPYSRTPFDTLFQEHKREDECYDLAELIFGAVCSGQNLKGRVQFSNAISNNAIENEEVKLIPGSPKASYYPIYIRQQQPFPTDARGNSHYLTYNDGVVSGWKRYHIRNYTWTNATGNENPEIQSIVKPISKGTVFKGVIRYHNLREIELGALLSALTFHNNSDQCFHQIGQAKPFGYGKVKIKISTSNLDVNRLMGKFEEAMETYVPNWYKSEQVVQLFTLAHEPVRDEDLYKYMNLDVQGRNNEFQKAKDVNEYMKLYTELSNKSFIPESIYRQIKKDDDKRIQQLEQEKKELNRILSETEKQKAIDLYNDGRYEEARNKFDEVSRLGFDSCVEEILRSCFEMNQK